MSKSHQSELGLGPRRLDYGDEAALGPERSWIKQGLTARILLAVVRQPDGCFVGFRVDFSNR